MNSLVEVNNLIESSIDKDNYLISFVSKLREYNLISEEKYTSIMFDLLYLVKTKLNSEVSSVSKEKFKRINSSYMWVISYYLRKFNFEERANTLLNYDIKYIYLMSLEFVKEDYSKLKLFYNTVFLKNVMEVDNYFYIGTLKDGLRAFFDKYDYLMDSENYIISVDYEAYQYRPSSKGIEFISDYMKEVNFENVFVKKFDIRNVNMLLKRYIYDYKVNLVNIFELVVNTSLILEYLNKDVYSLNLSESEVKLLYSDNCLEENLGKCYNELVQKLNFGNEEVEYLFSKKSVVIKNIMYLKKHNLLNKLVRFDNVIIYKCNLSFLEIISSEDITESEVLSLFRKLNVVELMVVRKYGSDYIVSLLNQYMYSLNNKISDYIRSNYIYVEVEYEK